MKAVLQSSVQPLAHLTRLPAILFQGRLQRATKYEPANESQDDLSGL